MPNVELILRPDVGGSALAGFRGGGDLTLRGAVGETVGTLLGRFNAFRAPGTSIVRLWRTDGSQLPFSTVLNAATVAIVKRDSI
jgi:hypothetical protein